MDNLKTYDVRISETQEFENCRQYTMNFSRKDNTQLDVDEVIKIAENTYNRAANSKKKVDFVIRGLIGDQWTTLKGKNQEMMDLVDFIEYYEGRVEDTTKFERFSQIDIVMWVSKK